MIRFSSIGSFLLVRAEAIEKHSSSSILAE
jgi:hypothetical protein